MDPLCSGSKNAITNFGRLLRLMEFGRICFWEDGLWQGMGSLNFVENASTAHHSKKCSEKEFHPSPKPAIFAHANEEQTTFREGPLVDGVSHGDLKVLYTNQIHKTNECQDNYALLPTNYQDAIVWPHRTYRTHRREGACRVHRIYWGHWTHGRIRGHRLSDHSAQSFRLIQHWAAHSAIQRCLHVGCLMPR